MILAYGTLATPQKPTAASASDATQAEGKQVCWIVSVRLLISISKLLVLTECHHLASSADVLDVKTLGCAKAEECDVETTVELFPNKTVFVMTKHCCDTPFCNSAHKLPIRTPLYLAAAFLTTWLITEASTRPQ